MGIRLFRNHDHDRHFTGQESGGVVSVATCTPKPCYASNEPNKDGSDGAFYCVHDGIIGGTTGSCACTDVCATNFHVSNSECAPCSPRTVRLFSVNSKQ